MSSNLLHIENEICATLHPSFEDEAAGYDDVLCYQRIQASHAVALVTVDAPFKSILNMEEHGLRFVLVLTTDISVHRLKVGFRSGERVGDEW